MVLVIIPFGLFVVSIAAYWLLAGCPQPDRGIMALGALLLVLSAALAVLYVRGEER